MFGRAMKAKPTPEPTMSADEIRHRLRDIELAMWHDRNGYSQPVDDARCAEWFSYMMLLKRVEDADRKIGKTDTKGSC